MEKEIRDYLINYYLHLLPPELVSKLKYAYLQEEEMEEECNKVAETLMRDYQLMLEY